MTKTHLTQNASDEERYLEELSSKVSQVQKEWSEAWAEGLPMPARYRSENPLTSEDMDHS
jgi:hypothetical protein